MHSTLDVLVPFHWFCQCFLASYMQVETVLKVYEKYATLQEVKDEDGWALIHLKRKE